MPDREEFLQPALDSLVEAEALIARTRTSLGERRYVEAEAWLAALAETLDESRDAFGFLASGERASVREGDDA